MSKNNDVREKIEETVDAAEEAVQDLVNNMPVEEKKPGFLKKHGKKILTHGIAAACGFALKVIIDVVTGGSADVPAAVETKTVDGITTTTF